MAFGDFSLPGLPDPWSFESADPLSALSPIKRRPITEEEANSTLGTIANAGLAGLGWVGSTLEKSLGLRSIRAAIDTLIGSGQHASDILSVLPFSETLGITSPENRVSGAELSKNVTGYDPSQGNWAERNLVGPAIEMALDPTMYLGGIGALTRLGKGAEMAGELTKGFLPSIGAGERTLAYGLTGPTVEAAARSVLGGVRRANEALVGLPKIGGPIAGIEDLLGGAVKKARAISGALFDPLAGGSYDPLIQEANRTARFPKQQEILKDVLGSEMDYREALRKVMPAGADPYQYSQYLTQAIENVVPELRQTPAGATPEVVDALNQLAGQISERYREMPRVEQAIGLPSAQLTDPLIEYAHRRAVKAPTLMFSSTADRGAAEARLLGERSDLLTGIPGGTVQIQQWAANPELAGAAATLPREERVARILEDLTNASVGQGVPNTPEVQALLQEAPARAEKIASFLEGIKPEYIAAEAGGRPSLPFFGIDPFEDLRIRGQAHAQRMGTAEGIWSVLKDKARLASEIPGGKDLVDVMDRLGIGTTTGREGALKQAVDRLGIRVSPDTPADELRYLLRGYSLPEDVAKSLLHEQTGYHLPEALQPVVDLYDKFLNLFKSSMYGPWPASHVRNLVSGEWENLMATPGLGKLPFGPTSQEALDVLRGRPVDLPIPGWEMLTPEEKAFKLRRELYARGGIGLPPGEMNETIGRPLSTVERPNPATPFTQTAGEFLKEAAAQPGAWNPLNTENFVPFKAGRQVGTNVENYLRLSQFNDLLQKGWSLDTAAEAIKKTHFDYGALADFEKNVMKRIFPFYTFTRKNIPKQIERAIQEPAKQMIPIRLLAQGQLGSEGPGYIPQYMAGSLAIPMGPEDETGTQRYLAGLGLPFEEAFGRIKGGTGPLDQLKNTLESLMGMTTPVFKGPMEWMTGQQFYSGRELPALTTSNTLATLFGETPTARNLNQLIANTPASRVLSTIDRLADLRKDPLTKLLGLTTGMNLTDVQMEKMRGQDIRNLVKAYLEQAPYVSESTDFYVSPQNREKVSAEDLAVLDLARWQQAQARKAKKLHPAAANP